jgi:DNA-binding transcriptional LysR family regulator
MRKMGVIAAAAATTAARAFASVKKRHRQLQIWAEGETSEVMLPKLAKGEPDSMIGRVFARQNPFTADIRYEPLANEPPCVAAYAAILSKMKQV